MNRQQTLSLLAIMFLAVSVFGQYANVREKLDNDYLYVVDGTTLKFSYVERYPIVEPPEPGANKLVKYTIYDEQHHPVTGTPAYVQNKYGLNEHEIELPVLNMSTCNGFYILEVTGPNKGETYYLRFTFNIGSPVTNPTVASKVFLDGPYDPSTGLMRDELRKLNATCDSHNQLCNPTQTIPPPFDDDCYLTKFPTIEPYSCMQYFGTVPHGEGNTIDESILNVNGNNAIVDWVLLELLEATDNIQNGQWVYSKYDIRATRAALVQRDGDIVDLDGRSAVVFNLESNVPVTDDQFAPREYYLSVRHRNHLGIMTAEPISINTCTTTSIDFTNPNTPTWGTNARKNNNGKMTMWGGDFNSDGRVIYSGPGNDILRLFTTVLYDARNTNLIANFISEGYYNADFDFDGTARYQGPSNDRSMLLQRTTLKHPNNTSLLSSFVILEQLP